MSWSREGGLVERELVEFPGKPIALALAPLDVVTGDELCVLGYEGQRDAAGVVRVLSRGSAGWRELGKAQAGPRSWSIRVAGDHVVASAQNGHHLGLWRSATKDGRFMLTALPELGVGTGPLGIALADVDGDGLLDIVCANAFSDDVSILPGR